MEISQKKYMKHTISLECKEVLECNEKWERESSQKYCFSQYSTIHCSFYNENSQFGSSAGLEKN
jgi:predicted transcriptional regulator